MFKFGTASKKKLSQVHPDLVAVAERALMLSPYDFTIVHGWRGEEVQNALFDSRASHKRWPDSKHNKMSSGYFDQVTRQSTPSKPCSEAIDFAPWVNKSIAWDDTHIFAVIAGLFHAAASEQGVVIRYGGDWDTDGSTKDQTLMDWGHVEIIL
jgi:peptidoglycan L-alanyl-D-glutamate endopeptidase CwlK